jgi:hypothetical protein
MLDGDGEDVKWRNSNEVGDLMVVVSRIANSSLSGISYLVSHGRDLVLEFSLESEV